LLVSLFDTCASSFGSKSITPEELPPDRLGQRWGIESPPSTFPNQSHTLSQNSSSSCILYSTNHIY
jgi:hypothetical protein